MSKLNTPIITKQAQDELNTRSLNHDVHRKIIVALAEKTNSVDFAEGVLEGALELVRERKAQNRAALRAACTMHEQ
ncbi:MAG: hypothetical protein DRQ48_01920 [Gammaproteobacteria bacterium]|nr:MAG: hypothetical protein DRQ48_01920 [Gammaproteobacteria bacterium]